MAKSLVSAIITRKSRNCRKFNFFLINNVSVNHAVDSRAFSATAALAAFAKLTPTEVGGKLIFVLVAVHLPSPRNKLRSLPGSCIKMPAMSLHFRCPRGCGGTSSRQGRASTSSARRAPSRLWTSTNSGQTSPSKTRTRRAWQISATGKPSCSLSSTATGAPRAARSGGGLGCYSIEETHQTYHPVVTPQLNSVPEG